MFIKLCYVPSILNDADSTVTKTEENPYLDAD